MYLALSSSLLVPLVISPKVEAHGMRVLTGVDPSTFIKTPVIKLFCIEVGIIINQKSQRSKYASEKPYIAVLKKVRYALCPRRPMPYALCPMPYAQSYLIFLRKAINSEQVKNLPQA